MQSMTKNKGRFCAKGGVLAWLLRTALWLTALAAAPALADPAQTPPGYCQSGKTVKLAGLNWESGAFLTALVREILERGYGCKTETVPGNTIALEQALADNDIQILPEEWISRSDAWKKASDAGKVQAVGHPFTQSSEGWYVPDYLVHGDPARRIAPAAPNLRAVGQLNDPRYIALFRDPEQPARGRFLNCPSGWTCEGVNTAKLAGYGLNGAYVDFRPGTGPAMDAAIQATYAQGRPLLFYYWSPSAIAGKLKLFQLKEPPYSHACWKELTSKTGKRDRACAAPPAVIAYGVSTPFAQAAPEIVSVLRRATVPIEVLNASLVATSAEPKTEAVNFLRTRPEVWRDWIPPAIAARIDASLQDQTTPKAVQSASSFPAAWTVSIRKPVNAALDHLVSRYGGGFRAAAQVLLNVVVGLDGLLAFLPWPLMIVLFMGLAWLGTRRWSLTVTVGVLMFGLGLLGLWDLMLQTLSLMLISSALAFVLGGPLGIAAAKSQPLKTAMLPGLDIMQTMPSFVYLIPALMLFGLGKAPAILATVIYCLPPMVRLTMLGIEQVDPEIKEAGTAFGLTPLQMLWRVELPLARPTIMAGVNQMVMLALSMVVVASMIGARGLGEQVLNGIQTLDVGQGLEAGVGIVILAFVLDRISQGFGAAKNGGDA